MILGIDPGSSVTGYGIIASTHQGWNLIDFGSILLPAKETMYHKHCIVFDKIEFLIDKYHPCAVAIETHFVHKNAQSALKIGMIRAVATLPATKKKIEIFEYAPTKIKLAVVGHGLASKIQVKQMVEHQLGLPSLEASEDETDALAIALCHAFSQSSEF